MNDDVIIINHRRLTSFEFDENDSINDNDLNSLINNVVFFF
jgi:hypothetical protein